ncbi:hypothetical protein [Pedobacter faecalis]|uniref:hypothetical protein n=1 Tax=Pedobacter faecalis TaxID=3041495 RepID=UPI00254B6D99|nr:hypothetical protein [Pedobacter sp. ELA7]
MEADKDYGIEEVPEQKVGSEMNAVERRTFDSEQEAMAFFEQVKNRMLDVNQWANMAKLPMSTFQLIGSSRVRAERLAVDGDYIRIDVPGPGTLAGCGYDWVRIERISAQKYPNVDVLTMTVRPSVNPMNDDQNIAHFLKDSATSTFQVKRIGKEVFAEEHARNEVPNTSTTHTLDNIRNTLVGWSAKIGLSYPQWKGLVKGLLD